MSLTSWALAACLCLLLAYSSAATSAPLIIAHRSSSHAHAGTPGMPGCWLFNTVTSALQGLALPLPGRDPGGL